MLNALIGTGVAILVTAGLCLCVAIVVGTARALSGKDEGKCL